TTSMETYGMMRCERSLLRSAAAVRDAIHLAFAFGDNAGGVRQTVVRRKADGDATGLFIATGLSVVYIVGARTRTVRAQAAFLAGEPVLPPIGGLARLLGVLEPRPKWPQPAQ